MEQARETWRWVHLGLSDPMQGLLQEMERLKNRLPSAPPPQLDTAALDWGLGNQFAPTQKYVKLLQRTSQII